MTKQGKEKEKTERSWSSCFCTKKKWNDLSERRCWVIYGFVVFSQKNGEQSFLNRKRGKVVTKKLEGHGHVFSKCLWEYMSLDVRRITRWNFVLWATGFYPTKSEHFTNSMHVARVLDFKWITECTHCWLFWVYTCIKCIKCTKSVKRANKVGHLGGDLAGKAPAIHIIASSQCCF